MTTSRTFLLTLAGAGALTSPLLAQAPLYELSGGAASAQLGAAVCTLPDIDGDGVEEFAIGAPYDLSAGARKGSVAIHSGRYGELLLRVFGPHDLSEFGRSLGRAPDLDGDGRADLLVGAPGAIPAFTANGCVYVLSSVSGAILRTHAGTMFGERMGQAVGWIGDCDADGVNDYAIGAPYANLNGFTRNGRVRALSGATGAEIATTSLSQDNALYGWSLAWAGDYDLDARPDYIVGAPGYTNAGNPSIGFARVVSGATHLGVAGFAGSQANEQLGTAVAGLADVTGDGHSEVAVGAPGWNGTGVQRGRVRVFAGGSGLALWSTEGLDTWRLGAALARTRDFDGDGLLDIAIGVPQFHMVNVGTLGAVRIHTSSTGELKTTLLGTQDGCGFGLAVAGAFDLNSDGSDELLVGAPYATSTQLQEGTARLLLGDVMRPHAYCTSKTNSAGCAPSLSSTGAPSRMLADNFHIQARDVLPQQVGVLFWSLGQASAPFMGGTLCLAPPVVRTGGMSSGGTDGCTGSFDFHFSHALMAAAPALAPGVNVHAQIWYRDPGFPEPNNMGLTNALRFEIAK